MHITPTMLNIPPYISTTWDNIESLRTERSVLHISLKNGETTLVPELNKSALETIFEAHARFLEKQSKSTPPFTIKIPFNPNNMSSLASLTPMHHTPEESELPDIPADLLEKIAHLTKSFGGEEVLNLRPADSTCNCTYCQIARAVVKLSGEEIEEIDEQDLTFRDWQVEEIGPKLYCVTSPLDQNEQYKVFLGEPLGCNCGENHCEHIKAVLES